MSENLRKLKHNNFQDCKPYVKTSSTTSNRSIKSTLKVLGGIYKGRKLQMVSLETTRSSKAILKESLFNTLSQSIFGVNFIEFFAGSGSIGIEALSRGAYFALFFECNVSAYEVLKLNLQTICQSDESYRVILGDTFCHYLPALQGLKYPCIGYIDPPFHLRKGMQDIYENCYQMIANLDKKLFKLIVLEHISSLTIPSNIGAFNLIKSKKFGKSSLSYFE